MATTYVPDDMNEKSKAKLTAISKKHFERRLALWKQTAPKRELADQLRLKLTKDDKKLEQLVKKAHDVSVSLSKNGKNLPEPKETEEPPPAPTIQLNYPWELIWADSSVPNDPPLAIALNLDPPFNYGSMRLQLRTDRGRSLESGFMAMGAWFQPSTPGWMNVSCNPTVNYLYGNSNSESYTRAWIGLVIQEWTLDGHPVRDAVNQQVPLWTLTTAHDFIDGNPVSLWAGIPVVSNLKYAIWVRAGGEVGSNELSYADLGVFLSNIFIQL
ncbi:hypothetical protein PCL_12104 [Purpureocillium lilacinum]|uniref:Uncharacterized protein n=1 Tax=Purpureocillium lilacinum TaxID=33203 RepID=A0A2U3DPF8_PURLI|nr:hypothetical protein PCL_12104 [Purpureocillium lilacinum]